MSSHANDKRVILVTGSNKGIGLEAVRQLSELLPNATILMGSRSIDNGEKALTKLKQAASSPSAYSNVHVLLLDVTDRQSITRAAEHVQQHYKQLDVLINNSGISNVDGDSSHPGVLAVNLFGVRDMVEAFLPLLAPGATVITVSSEVGAWTTSYFEPVLQEKVTDIDRLTWDDIKALAADYTAYSRGQRAQRHWPDKRKTYGMYGISKALVTAYTRLLARQLSGSYRVCIVCPGYCSTDLNEHRGPRSPVQGGSSVIWPVLHDFDNGHFYQDGKKYPFVTSRPTR